MQNKEINERVSVVMVSITDCGSVGPCSIHGLPIFYIFTIIVEIDIQ